MISDCYIKTAMISVFIRSELIFRRGNSFWRKYRKGKTVCSWENILRTMFLSKRYESSLKLLFLATNYVILRIWDLNGAWDDAPDNIVKPFLHILSNYYWQEHWIDSKGCCNDSQSVAVFNIFNSSSTSWSYLSNMCFSSRAMYYRPALMTIKCYLINKARDGYFLQHFKFLINPLISILSNCCFLGSSYLFLCSFNTKQARWVKAASSDLILVVWSSKGKLFNPFLVPTIKQSR